MTTFKISVVEYASLGGKALPPPLPPPFVVNDRQLVVAMVRSILTINSGKKARKYMAAIVKPTLHFLIDWSRPPALCLSTAFLDGVRDFSVTGRIGELAQGVSYAYWTWVRGYSWITDFGPWASSLAPPYAGKKSPDYVMFNPSTGDIALMEAKGTRSANHKPPMGMALRQCKAALTKVLATRGFGSVLTLDSKNPAGIGTLHIRDPEGAAEVTDEMAHYLFRRSYASWFDMVGDDERATECRKAIVDKFAGSSTTRTAVPQRKVLSPLRAITTEAIGFDPDRTSFELDPEIESALFNEAAFRSLDWDQFLERMMAGPEPDLKRIRFPDGTSIVEH